MRDIEALKPTSTTPIGKPCDFNLSIYGAASARAARDAPADDMAADAADPHVRAYGPPLLETGVRRRTVNMSEITKDARYAKGQYLLLRPNDGHGDPFWVGKLIQDAWVDTDAETGEDMAMVRVEWWVPGPKAGKVGGYRGWLKRMVDAHGDPMCDTTEIVSVYMHFTPEETTRNKQSLIRVPAAAIRTLKASGWGGDPDRVVRDAPPAGDSSDSDGSDSDA
jgi:hypothetical protein